ncbi:hypothetical protein diail_2533 [Diaporthe ilicicola]|nr:hypothetical protein diail_2533 [Diaporthe ilicicola]
MSSARPDIMIAKAGCRSSIFIFPLLFTSALSSPSHSRHQPRLDHIPLGLPDLPPGLFITYTGVLTGSFRLEPSGFPFDATQCGGGSGTYFFTDTANSTVRVGINPPSIDPNPLFFMIQQDEQALPLPLPVPVPEPVTDTPRPTLPSITFATPIVLPIPIFSPDPRDVHAVHEPPATRQAAADPVLPPGTARTGGFQNLLFASLYTLCTRDSRPCGIMRTADQGTESYDAHRVLDLTGSGLLTKTTASGGDGDENGPSYTLRGDQSTWASSDTIGWSGLEFSPPENYTTATNNPAEPAECAAYRYPPLVWNSSTPFTYALRFSNASATLSLVLTAPLGTVTLGFAGARVALVDAGGGGGGGGAANVNATATAIQVESGDGDAPRWSFVNGSDFHFVGVTAVANDSAAGGGLSSAQGGLGSGADAGVVEAAAWASWGSGFGVAVVLAALLL